MIDTISVCYLLKLNKGSEWLLGENTYRTLVKGNYIITAKHQIEGDFCDGTIGQFNYKRKDGRIAVIGMFGRNSEPKTPMGFRFDYLIWSLRVYALLRKRAGRSRIHHINFAQILTYITKRVRESKGFVFGPVGGQGPWFKVKFLPFAYRLVNYLIFEWIYGAIVSRIRKMNVVFVHPILAKRFGGGRIQPAIKLMRELYVGHDKKNQVIHVSRRVYFKLPDLHRKLFEELSTLNPEFDFILFLSRWIPSLS
jgi:hypothetical protein